MLFKYSVCEIKVSAPFTKKYLVDLVLVQQTAETGRRKVPACLEQERKHRPGVMPRPPALPEPRVLLRFFLSLTSTKKCEPA